MGDEEVILVGQGQVVESFESQGEYFEMYMLFDGETVGSEENGCEGEGAQQRPEEMKVWIRDSAAGGDRQCLILAMRQRWK